jgi:hypothetical protein
MAYDRMIQIVDITALAHVAEAMQYRRALKNV